MAKVKFSKGSEEWVLFMDFWQICQDYFIPEDNDTYWENLIEVISVFTEKYKNTKNYDFAKRVSIAFIESREKVLNEQK